MRSNGPLPKLRAAVLMLVDDLVDGRLPCHILSELTKKLKRKIKAVAKARLMTKKDDTDFKKKFCGEGSIPVGKLEPLLAMYTSIKEGQSTLEEMSMKDRTRILFSALYCHAQAHTIA